MASAYEVGYIVDDAVQKLQKARGAAVFDVRLELQRLERQAHGRSCKGVSFDERRYTALTRTSLQLMLQLKAEGWKLVCLVMP